MPRTERADHPAAICAGPLGATIHVLRADAATTAVARIVRRRQRASMRVGKGEFPPYAAPRASG